MVVASLEIEIVARYAAVYVCQTDKEGSSLTRRAFVLKIKTGRLPDENKLFKVWKQAI